MSDLSAEDQQLIADVEEVMAGDVHGARTKMCHFGIALRRDSDEKADLYRRQLRAYVARRKAGENITIKDICEDMIRENACVELWFGYQCRNGDCGTVLDVRMNKISDPENPPEINCPQCGDQLDFCGYWSPDACGYGSGGDRAAHLKEKLIPHSSIG